MRKNHLLLSIFVLAILVSGCATGPTATTQPPAPDTGTDKLLIAAYVKDPAVDEEDSEFLDSVSTKFMEGLKDDNVAVQVTTVAELSSLPIESYPAVVVISYQEDQQVKEALARKANQENVFLFTAFESPRLKINGEYVDAITSASKRYDPDFVSAALIERVSDVLPEEL